MPDAAPVAIREAQIDDADAIAALSETLGYPVTAAQIAARLRTIAASPRHAVFVATAARGGTTDGADAGGGGIDAWIAVERRLLLESGERAEITGLVVAAHAQRRGLGRRLVASAERWALDQGLPEMSVRSNIARSESHPFYVSLGYRRTKSQHVYRRRLDPAG